MSLIVSRSPPLFGSVSSSKERRWISIKWGTSRGFSRREKLLRVTGAAFERAKSATPRAVRGTKVKRRSGQENSNSARPGKITHGDARLQAWLPDWDPRRRCGRLLLELDGRAGLLKFSFELVGLLALDALFDRFRSLVDD